MHQSRPVTSDGQSVEKVDCAFWIMDPFRYLTQTSINLRWQSMPIPYSLTYSISSSSGSSTKSSTTESGLRMKSDRLKDLV